MTETLEARKSRQRTELRQRLADIGEDRQRSAAAEIDRLLRERLGDRLAEGVLAFHPLPDEPDLRPLLLHLLGRGHLLCLPGGDWEKKTMTPLRLESLDGTRRGRHGVVEPQPRTPIDAGERARVLVPGRGVDRRGRRLGRGGGFYDRFLADCHLRCFPSAWPSTNNSWNGWKPAPTTFRCRWSLRHRNHRAGFIHNVCTLSLESEDLQYTRSAGNQPASRRRIGIPVPMGKEPKQHFKEDSPWHSQPERLQMHAVGTCTDANDAGGSPLWPCWPARPSPAASGGTSTAAPDPGRTEPTASATAPTAPSHRLPRPIRRPATIPPETTVTAARPKDGPPASERRNPVPRHRHRPKPGVRPVTETAATTPPPTAPITPETNFFVSGTGDATTIQQARQLLGEDRPVEARTLLSNALGTGTLTPAQLDEARYMLTSINDRLIFSPEVVPGDPFVTTYTVKKGDSLGKIVKSLGVQVDWRFLQRVNGLTRPNQIRPGQVLKIVTGPFHASVERNSHRLDLYIGEGPNEVRPQLRGPREHGCTPSGLFRAANPSGQSSWTNPRTREHYAANDPENPSASSGWGSRGSTITTARRRASASTAPSNRNRSDATNPWAASGCGRVRST